jgi:hypothetical protein
MHGQRKYCFAESIGDRVIVIVDDQTGKGLLPVHRFLVVDCGRYALFFYSCLQAISLLFVLQLNCILSKTGVVTLRDKRHLNQVNQSLVIELIDFINLSLSGLSRCSRVGRFCRFQVVL